MEFQSTNSDQLRYTENKASAADILQHLQLCQDDFIPPLHETVDIEKYSIKLFQNSVTFETWKNAQLVGLLAIYLNDKSNQTGFITNVSVLKEFAGNGIATDLLRRCINHAQKKYFSEISLQVNVRNKTAIKLYENFHFTADESQTNTITMRLIL